MRLIDAEAWKLELLLLHGTNEKTAWIINRINHAPTVDAVPVSFIEELKAWAKENGSAEYANDLTHLLSVWAERKEGE